MVVFLFLSQKGLLMVMLFLPQTIINLAILFILT